MSFVTDEQCLFTNLVLRPGDKLYVIDARDDNWWFVSEINYWLLAYMFPFAIDLVGRYSHTVENFLSDSMSQYDAQGRRLRVRRA